MRRLCKGALVFFYFALFPVFRPHSTGKDYGISIVCGPSRDQLSGCVPCQCQCFIGQPFITSSDGEERKGGTARGAAAHCTGCVIAIASPESLTGQVIVTSGGTEGNNLVLQQPKWRFIITMATEHHSVFFPAQYMSNQLDCEVIFLSVDGQGRVADVNELRHTLSGRCARGSGLVSLALTNNETGTILDLASIGQIIQEVNQKRARE